MSLSSAEVGAIVEELRPLIQHGWLQKIHQPTPRTLTLNIRAGGHTWKLLLSAEPALTRLHLTSQRYPNPPAPPPFCQYLRSHIQGGRLDAISRSAHDRIVHLSLTTKQGPRTLVAELMGRQADVILLDADARVMATLRNDRERIGRPYQPPGDRPDASRPEGIEPRVHAESLSAFLEARYAAQEREQSRDQARQAKLTELRKAVKKAERLIEAMQGDLQKARRYEGYDRYGELLKANLQTITKGLAQVTVVDYYDPALPTLTLPLNPAKSPKGNMDDYFAKHRKWIAAEREVRPRLDATDRKLKALRAELAAVQRDDWEPPNPQRPSVRRASAGRGSTTPSPHLSPVSRHPKRSGPYRRFMSADGCSIYVGRNAKENEALTFTFAHSDDLWLHVQGVPGSHVVVRLDKGADPSPDTLRDAATLALLYSDLKKSGKGDVIYTRRKWVRKAKGQAPGMVTVTREKAIFATLDKTRLHAIKERTHERG